MGDTSGSVLLDERLCSAVERLVSPSQIPLTRQRHAPASNAPEGITSAKSPALPHGVIHRLTNHPLATPRSKAEKWI